MSDLAYVRTAGDEMAEVPQTPTRIRKSGISPKQGETSLDPHKTPKSLKKESSKKRRDKEGKKEVQKEINDSFEAKPAVSVKNSPILEEALKAPTLCTPENKDDCKINQFPVVMMSPLCDKKKMMLGATANVDAESYLTTHSVPKQSLKLQKIRMSGGAMKKKKIGFKMRSKNYKKRVFINRPRVDSVDEGDGIVRAEGPAAVNDLLAAAFHLGVVALHTGEIEGFAAGAAAHGAGRAAAEADEHGGAAEDDELVAGVDLLFLHVPGLDVAETTREHDGLVVAAQFRGWGVTSDE